MDRKMVVAEDIVNETKADDGVRQHARVLNLTRDCRDYCLLDQPWTGASS